MKTPIDLLESMERELESLQVRTYRASSKEALWDLIEAIVSATPGANLGLENRSLIRSLDLQIVLSSENRSFLGFSRPDRPEHFKKESWAVLQDLDISIGGADYALADTGTLVLFSKNTSGRWPSLAPTVHIALLPADRILPSLESLFAQWGPEENLPSLGSAVVFITGPSRTADIELKLVMGAHGPKELHVITLLFPC
jgi:L-lactate dehydrogenase complex protein LldG